MQLLGLLVPALRLKGLAQVRQGERAALIPLECGLAREQLGGPLERLARRAIVALAEQELAEAVQALGDLGQPRPLVDRPRLVVEASCLRILGPARLDQPAQVPVIGRQERRDPRVLDRSGQRFQGGIGRAEPLVLPLEPGERQEAERRDRRIDHGGPERLIDPPELAAQPTLGLGVTDE